MNNEDDSSDPFEHLPEGIRRATEATPWGSTGRRLGVPFPPGSREPKGKRKGKHVSTLVREAFTEPRVVSIGGRQRNVPTILALIYQAQGQASKATRARSQRTLMWLLASAFSTSLPQTGPKMAMRPTGRSSKT